MLPSYAFPRSMDLENNFDDIFTENEISLLTDYIVIDHRYTVIYSVSSTCDGNIKIGFGGSGGFFITTVPPNSNRIFLSVTDVWKRMPTRLEARQACEGETITIHHISLVEAGSDCLPSTRK